MVITCSFFPHQSFYTLRAALGAQQDLIQQRIIPTNGPEKNKGYRRINGDPLRVWPDTFAWKDIKLPLAMLAFEPHDLSCGKWLFQFVRNIDLIAIMKLQRINQGSKLKIHSDRGILAFSTQQDR